MISRANQLVVVDCRRGDREAFIDNLLSRGSVAVP